MMGLSGAIELARRAMMAHQTNLDVIGQNIANVNTPGYTRQRAVLGASLPMRQIPGQLGTGVEVLDVQRNRDLFADRQFRREKGIFGQLDAKSSVLGQVESLFNEPSETGVSTLLDKFFSSWSDLSNNPSDRGAKGAVQSAGKALSDHIRYLDTRLGEYRTQLNDEIDQRATEVNRLTKQVAELNKQIVAQSGPGSHPNDLMDQRDRIVDELSESLGTTAIAQPDGSVSLRLGGKSIVDGQRAETLSLQARGLNDPNGAPVLYSDGSAASITSGRLGGLIEMRDQTLVQMRGGLDQLAQGLIAEVNGLHTQGLNGVAFFAGTDAHSLDLSAAVAGDANAINSSRTSYGGANDLALELAALKGKGTLNGGRVTFGGFFGGLVAGLGSETKAAIDGARNQALAVQQVDNQRQATAGVNIDEELANLTQSQKAYQAAARYMTTVSDMLNTIINDLGR